MSLPRQRLYDQRKGLIRARELMGMSRPELAERLGFSKHFVFAVESGIRSPCLKNMRRWVDALGHYGTLELFREGGPPKARPVEKSAA